METAFGVLTIPEILSTFFKINQQYKRAFIFLKDREGVTISNMPFNKLETPFLLDFKAWLKDEYENPWKREFFVEFENPAIQIDMTGRGDYIYIPCDNSGNDLLSTFTKLIPSE